MNFSVADLLYSEERRRFSPSVVESILLFEFQNINVIFHIPYHIEHVHHIAANFRFFV